MYAVRKQQDVIATQVERASTLRSRMVGLLGKKKLLPGQGMWIDRCNSIHTFFMKFAIDAVFISKTGEVLKIYENVKPFRTTRVVLGARSVLELPAGALSKTDVKTGDHLELEQLA